MASVEGEGPRQPSSDVLYSSIVGPLLEPLGAVARRILKRDDMARDAVQEAALSLWLEPEWPPNPRAWLIRAVIHRSLHLARTHARRRKYEARACRERLETTDRDEPSHLLEGDDLHRKLLEILSQMSTEHREVLVLKLLDGRDYESIAATLGIPIGTVRSRLNRSRKAFRQAVRQTLPDEYEHRTRGRDNDNPDG